MGRKPDRLRRRPPKVRSVRPKGKGLVSLYYPTGAVHLVSPDAPASARFTESMSMGLTRRSSAPRSGLMDAPIASAAPPWVAFAREFLRHPREVGSVLPSSPALGRAIADALPRRVRTVAEFGPGTGPITRELLAKSGRNVRIVAFEIDPHFCDVLATSIRDPRLTVLNRPAEDLGSVARELGIEFDSVVTSLPLVNFPVPIRNLILQAAKDTLPSGGIVTGYTYTPYVVPRLMRETFGNCALRFVWRNVPPAFVFRSVC